MQVPQSAVSPDWVAQVAIRLADNDVVRQLVTISLTSGMSIASAREHDVVSDGGIQVVVMCKKKIWKKLIFNEII